MAGLAARAVRHRAAIREALLSEALADSETSKAAVESILALTPAFHSFERYDDMIQAICSVAQETFTSRSASLYRHADGRLILLGREPATPLFPPDGRSRSASIPGLAEDLASGVPRFVPDTSNEMWPSTTCDLAQALGLRSVLRVPILIAPQSAYVLVIGWDDVRDTLDPAHLALAQRFADQAAVALEHAEAETLHKRLEQSLLSLLSRSPPLAGHRYPLPQRRTQVGAGR